MLCSRLLMLITGHLAHVFGHPWSIIALIARCQNASIYGIRLGSSRTKSLCECWNYLPLAFADNRQIQDSGSGLFAYARNTLITGGTFVVSLSCGPGLYKQLIIVHISSARTMSIFPPPILGKGTWRSLYFKNQTPVHCLLDGKMYLTSFGRFLFIVLIVNWCQGAPVSFGEQEGLERLRSVSNL